jgi:hypothetical protein
MNDTSAGKKAGDAAGEAWPSDLATRLFLLQQAKK